MEREIREIPGFPNYLVGNDGTVWTLKRKGGNDRGAGRLGPPRQIKTYRRGNGYVVAQFDVDGRVVTSQVHRLVLLAFVGPPPSPTHHGCHHPDPDPSNNRVENLRWDTPSENAKDKYRHLWDAPCKKCTRCGETKDRSEFYADTRNIDGRQGMCKPCHLTISVATRDMDKRRKANREFMREWRRKKAG